MGSSWLGPGRAFAGTAGCVARSPHGGHHAEHRGERSDQRDEVGGGQGAQGGEGPDVVKDGELAAGAELDWLRVEAGELRAIFKASLDTARANAERLDNPKASRANALFGNPKILKSPNPKILRSPKS